MLGEDTMITIGFALSAIALCVLIGTASGYPVANWLSDRMTSFLTPAPHRNRHCQGCPR